MRWSKTIQFRERVVQLPLPLIPGSPLGPATAIQRALSFITTPPPPPPSQSQAFMWQDPISFRYKVFTYMYSKFLRRVHDILQALGLPTKDFASHSFWRWGGGGGGGGASFAFRAGLPVDLIKILSFCQLDAILLYLTVPLSIRLEYVNAIANTILSAV